MSRLHASLPDWKALLAVPPIRPISLGTGTTARGESTILLVRPAVSHCAGADVPLGSSSQERGKGFIRGCFRNARPALGNGSSSSLPAKHCSEQTKMSLLYNSRRWCGLAVSACGAGGKSMLSRIRRRVGHPRWVRSFRGPRRRWRGCSAPRWRRRPSWGRWGGAGSAGCWGCRR